jgi:leader peptidase (prepilin peptidase) / N-methyltransferase
VTLSPDVVPVVSVLFGLAGLGWGFVADRIGARWPAHEDGSVRPIDWRTAAVMLIGGGAMYLLPGRFADVTALAIFGVWFLILELLLATDLDQRLLPDVITLPMIPIALAIAASGADPLVRGQLLLAVIAAVALPLLLFALSIPFGAGAIGLGDIKLLVSVGLLTGLGRAVLGVIAGALLSGVVVILLLATRRVTLKSYIPFGPFLIAGAFWSVLLST